MLLIEPHRPLRISPNRSRRPETQSSDPRKSILRKPDAAIRSLRDASGGAVCVGNRELRHLAADCDPGDFVRAAFRKVKSAIRPEGNRAGSRGNRGLRDVAAEIDAAYLFRLVFGKPERVVGS